MTMMAVLSEARTADVPVTAAEAPRIAGVAVVRDIAAAEVVWRALEQPGQLFTPYQRYDFLSAWQRHVGTREGIEPFIVIATDAEQRPLLLLPLGIERRFGLRVAQFLGGKHTTFNMPLWRRDFAQSAGARDLAALIEGLRALPDGADVLALSRQPLQWNGQVNPMTLLPHQPSVNDCPVLLFTPGAPPEQRISKSFRSRLKGKERKLQALPGYRYAQAESDADVARVLDAFFKIKPVRMAAQKLPNVFAEPGVEGFIREACGTALASGGRAIDIHALESDDEMIAMFAGVADGGRYSMMFNTYTLSEASKYSPGLILMRSIVDHYADRGYRRLDLGIGSDDYKKMFCKDLEPVVDGFIALSPRGSIAAAALSSLGRAKRMVKQNPALMQLAKRLRGALRREPSSPQEN
jgi:CelD/BcsL family acetyltransferase involved in cellulose biosynthesis